MRRNERSEERAQLGEAEVRMPQIRKSMLPHAAVGSCFVIALCAIACKGSTSDSSAAPVKPHYAPTVIPPLTDVFTTADRTFIPKKARIVPESMPNPSLPENLQGYFDQGFADVDQQPGYAYVTRTIDDSTALPPGPNAKRLVRFVHLSDLQLADDESPTRLGTFDGSGSTNAALRPQDPALCRMANASVRTINALHAKDPIAFTLMGGDNSDSAQTNEIEWFLGILSGADSVECDSGDDDDIIAGPDNDGKDPFKADGLKMPWKWVTGNHDVLVQGNLKTVDNADLALGNTANGGTRRYDSAAPLKGTVDRGDFVVVDPKRKLLSRTDLMTKVASNGDGHGLSDAEKASGRATYTFDVDGTPFRVLALDTAHEDGGSEGVIKQSQVDALIKPLLDKAKADGKWVILASHHAAENLSNGNGLGGQVEPDALTPDQWLTLVSQYDNVLFSMVGHTHQHHVKVMKPASGQGHPYWEVMTGAIADYPHQFRLVEIYDQDNGWLMLRGTVVDFAFDGDPVAADAKKRGIIDYTGAWLPDNTTTNQDRNVEVWIKKP